MEHQEQYMRRCFDLARLGAGYVAPNPMVGAVVVYQGRIIGEGYHQRHGAAHAEVNAIDQVSDKDRALLRSATLYVSLEPCCFHGNTPPCTALIIRHQIPRVVISCLDESPQVSGKGVQQLRAAGCEVITGILESEGRQLSAIRNTFVTQQRPYILLKYAQSADGFIGQSDRQVWLSNALSRRLVHKWRHETSAILVGTGTALLDNPALTNRLYFGRQPLRIALDRHLSIPSSHHLLDDTSPTLIVTEQPPPTAPCIHTQFLQLTFDESLLPLLLAHLAKAQVSSLLVEGGAQTLQHFIDARLWDEARVLVAPTPLGSGIKAPALPTAPAQVDKIADNELRWYYRG